MPSAHLICLKNLREHYIACRELAAKGDWEGLTQYSARGLDLFQDLQHAAPLQQEERTEAKKLLTETLEADEIIRTLATSWLTDVEPLLRTLNKRP